MYLIWSLKIFQYLIKFYSLVKKWYVFIICLLPIFYPFCFPSCQLCFSEKKLLSSDSFKIFLHYICASFCYCSSIVYSLALLFFPISNSSVDFELSLETLQSIFSSGEPDFVSLGSYYYEILLLYFVTLDWLCNFIGRILLPCFDALLVVGKRVEFFIDVIVKIGCLYKFWDLLLLGKTLSKFL